MSENKRAEEIVDVVKKALDKLGVPEFKTDALREIVEFRTVLTGESDRGCALMATAYLEASLDKVISTFLVEDERVQKDVFSNKGFLETFSSKIDFAYLLGLITKSMHRDLHLLRKIRNEFAHNLTNLSFDSPAIRDRCSEFSYQNLDRTESSRDKFTRKMMGIDGELFATLSELKHLETKKESDLEKHKQLDGFVMNAIKDVNNA
ncbi:MAG: hypothetical protein A2W74_07800 [Planctomycetes bacterium RIFCSPLOWO2_12_38_17]|nr:MAG: hypothetical protein A2W74_07800 [Planctomycetes bacterium RIFCSPLOWO2_12_38_17]